jgi:hypothetical protein
MAIRCIYPTDVTQDFAQEINRFPSQHTSYIKILQEDFAGAQLEHLVYVALPDQESKRYLY